VSAAELVQSGLRSGREGELRTAASVLKALVNALTRFAAQMTKRGTEPPLPLLLSW
jgi:hypothetical protein